MTAARLLSWMFLFSAMAYTTCTFGLVIVCPWSVLATVPLATMAWVGWSLADERASARERKPIAPATAKYRGKR
jgi:hypothetical protein